MRIVSIDATPLHLGFIPAVAEHMLRATTHGPELTLYRVRLDDGTEGFGDDTAPPADLSQWVGRHVLETAWQAKHAGLEMACFDAAGQSLSLPVHALLGRQVRQRIPFAYWTIDLPPAVLAEQVRYAAALGYTSYKFKCRPWWDPREQLAAAEAVAPAGFRIWIDFNGHLRESRLALPVLDALAGLQCVGGFESPIPQRDVEGYQVLRRAIRKPIVGHTGGGCCHVESDRSYDAGVPWTVQLREQMFDGFVLGGNVGTLRLAGVAHEFRKPFWIQHVGTTLRAAWIAHLASVCDAALLSHLACHDLWAADIAASPPIRDGWMDVPTGPGLGVSPDLDRLATVAANERFVPRRTISTVLYPSGVRWSFADEQQRHEAFYFGHLPGFVAGVRLEVEQDDGSADFAARHAHCAEHPLVET